VRRGLTASVGGQFAAWPPTLKDARSHPTRGSTGPVGKLGVEATASTPRLVQQ